MAVARDSARSSGSRRRRTSRPRAATASTVAGTMAHSFIEAFPTEDDAFRRLRGGPSRRARRSSSTPTTRRTACATAIDVIEPARADRTGSASGWTAATSTSSRARPGACSTTRARPAPGSSRAEGSTSTRSPSSSTAGAPVDAFGMGRSSASRRTRRTWTRSTSSWSTTAEPAMKLSSARRAPPGRKQVWRAADGDHARPARAPRRGRPPAGTDAAARAGDARRQRARARSPALAELARPSSDDLAAGPGEGSPAAIPRSTSTSATPRRSSRSP